MPKFIYERKNWPTFTWDNGLILLKLSEVRYKQGRLLGKMEWLDADLRREAFLNTLTSDVSYSAKIENLAHNEIEVHTAIARIMGFNSKKDDNPNQEVDGLAEIIVDATKNAHLPLTKERLFKWHKALFSVEISETNPIITGKYRSDNPDQIQMAVGLNHPDASRMKREMKQFLIWFNESQSLDPVLKAGVAHFWFLTIYPFDEGNGQLARTMTDMLLSRSEHSNHRYFSISHQLLRYKKSYRKELERAQKGDLDLTQWLVWFLETLNNAIDGVEDSLSKILNKTRFWKLHAQTTFNSRQVSMINKMLGDFSESLTTSKWAELQKCSQDTALRDVQDLLKLKVLNKNSKGGRSTNCVLCDF